MIIQLIKAVVLILFLMIAWLAVNYFVRKQKKLSLDCDLLEHTRGCLSCALKDKCGKSHS
ncbi:MAG TPA: hypothetical protein ENJ10_09025 [Caldithrix abyssi]|uniref:FeoB-associated Cys-rich membrane protein n=1 Tax=Caldithrix abyssi TaxID=187145 RepID=A0A7V1LMN0_CALAY|nr:hypothetical protein [Caldithrix abyssi]